MALAVGGELLPHEEVRLVWLAVSIYRVSVLLTGMTALRLKMLPLANRFFFILSGVLLRLGVLDHSTSAASTS